jgi:hypothetical protein
MEGANLESIFTWRISKAYGTDIKEDLIYIQRNWG